ncbi:MAG: hypothetical protein ACLFU7_06665 [Armatimonadota bacterium]
MTEPVTEADAIGGRPPNYDANVFINCPFDSDYAALLRPLLFTVVHAGLNPRIASERLDSGETRVGKICELICESRYGIHDISRIKAVQADEFYRLNMPFELGIDYGARRFGCSFLQEKRHLVLEEKPYAYHKALSDLSGSDIKSHRNEPDEIVRAVRDWLYDTCEMDTLEYPAVIWSEFNDFASSLLEFRVAEGVPERAAREDVERMPETEYVHSIRLWLSGDAG